ncbi:DUF4062 domain-containing protein [Aureimonas phyllosphaerae]|uniref:DUF4062 domain-containing protein n=1 Tax=Aureimonas phyllosphaerae TaxID=1166078 RepID=A0A7W6FXE8_9HYPH|nr:DUF4062 domain-containing protein [Aureimonas phyllosphaerae]MBB3938042.1 hypothetical protein [Aureimonas phyllosphaerae]MBB3962082.1 hypothetical protein [Aureimonas phyllosphaerae]SFF54984.1 protein of unknown function [Aureimonas phyllosphaerae]
MKIFISSLIGGFEPFRAAAREAVVQLGHEPVMAEDFPPQPNSPQVACLAGLRQAALVLLVMGERYGYAGRSGISPTHEEYREARGRIPVAAFVQQGVTPEPEQKAFIDEVQGWEGGLFRGAFKTPDELRALVTRAIHEWQLANAARPMDEAELQARALAQLPVKRNGYSSYHRGQGKPLVVSLAFGPRQTILRPAEVENPELIDNLTQESLFGRARIFDRKRGTEHALEGDALVLTQGDGFARFRVSPTGDMLFHLPLAEGPHGMVVIEENVRTTLAGAMAFAVQVLERIDSTQRLTHLVPAVTLAETEHVVWRTQAEQDQSPNSYPMGLGGYGQDKVPAILSPAAKPRAALSLDQGHMVDDLVVTLRRIWKDRG